MTERIAINVQEAASMIGVSKSKMYQIIKRSDCDFAFMLDGRRLVSVSKLQEWIDKQAEARTA